MHTESTERWEHGHSFGQEHRREGERRTLSVVGITAAMMAAEIGAGLAFRSMALLADGLHMASHATALGISALAYFYARKHARDQRFNFGTGKMNSLAAFASAVMLAVVAVLMAGQSLERLLHPVRIDFNPALAIAAVGLAVNVASLLVLKGEHGHDHNLWSAYVHVMADAMTSILAIGALLAGKRYGAVWLDPLMGIVGACLVTHWAWGLIAPSGRVLLDMQAPEPLRVAVKRRIEENSDARVTDLHVWIIGPGIYSAALALVTSEPKPAEHYRALLPPNLGLVHTTIEVHRCLERAVVK